MTRGPRFTLAEDDDKFLFILQHLLTQNFPGCSFAAFTNAEDALEHILNSGTDLLVTDHGMGRMGGTELIQELRRKNSQIPIIMVSGNQTAEKEAIAAGANEFLNKNLVLTQLAERIKHYVLG
jgi:CheY-like chemotaxis protein